MGRVLREDLLGRLRLAPSCAQAEAPWRSSVAPTRSLLQPDLLALSPDGSGHMLVVSRWGKQGAGSSPDGFYDYIQFVRNPTDSPVASVYDARPATLATKLGKRAAL